MLNHGSPLLSQSALLCLIRPYGVTACDTGWPALAAETALLNIHIFQASIERVTELAALISCPTALHTGQESLVFSTVIH